MCLLEGMGALGKYRSLINWLAYMSRDEMRGYYGSVWLQRAGARIRVTCPTLTTLTRPGSTSPTTSPTAVLTDTSWLATRRENVWRRAGGQAGCLSADVSHTINFVQNFLPVKSILAKIHVLRNDAWHFCRSIIVFDGCVINSTTTTTTF